MAETLTFFAEVDPVTNVVLRVIVATRAFILTGVLGDPANWIRTRPDLPHRPRRFAGVGFIYDRLHNRFDPPP